MYEFQFVLCAYVGITNNGGLVVILPHIVQLTLIRDPGTTNI